MDKEQIIDQIVGLTAQLRQLAITDEEKNDAEKLNQLAYCYANYYCDIKKILSNN